MPYTIYWFDDLLLPEYNPSNDVSTPRFPAASIDLPAGGSYDVDGTAQSRRSMTPIRKRCTLAADSAADFRSAYNALRAKAGWRKRLWRQWDTDDLEWCWVRLQEIPATRDVEHRLHLPLELQFMMSSRHWYGRRHHAAWNLDDPGVYFDIGLVLDTDSTVTLTGSPQAILLTNNGNQATSEVVITLTAGSEALSNPMLSIAGSVELIYNGTILAGQSLVINIGAWSCLNNGVGDWDNLHRTANHAIAETFRLDPGTSTVTVVYSGGGTGSTILFAFSEAWV